MLYRLKIPNFRSLTQVCKGPSEDVPPLLLSWEAQIFDIPKCCHNLGEVCNQFMLQHLNCLNTTRCFQYPSYRKDKRLVQSQGEGLGEKKEKN